MTPAPPRMAPISAVAPTRFSAVTRPIMMATKRIACAMISARKGFGAMRRQGAPQLAMRWPISQMMMKTAIARPTSGSASQARRKLVCRLAMAGDSEVSTARLRSMESSTVTTPSRREAIATARTPSPCWLTVPERDTTPEFTSIEMSSRPRTSEKMADRRAAMASSGMVRSAAMGSDGAEAGSSCAAATAAKVATSSRIRKCLSVWTMS